MDLKAILSTLIPRHEGELTVDNTVGGVGFPANDLTYENQRARLIRCTVKGGDISAKEIGTPTATSGDPYFDGDEFFVPMHAIDTFRAIRAGAVNGTLQYHVYFQR